MEVNDDENDLQCGSSAYIPSVEEKSSSPPQGLLHTEEQHAQDQTQQSHAAFSVSTFAQQHSEDLHSTPLQSQFASSSSFADDDTAAQRVELPPFSGHSQQSLQHGTPQQVTDASSDRRMSQQASAFSQSSQRSSNSSQSRSSGRILGTPSGAVGTLPRGDMGHSMMFSAAAAQFQKSPIPAMGTPT